MKGGNDMEKLSLQQMSELYQNNPQKYEEIYGEKPKTFNELSLKEQNDLYNNSKEMYNYYLQNPNEQITMKTNDLHIEQQKIQKEMEQMRKEIIEEKEQLYKDFPTEMEWEQRIDKMVEESLNNLFKEGRI